MSFKTKLGEILGRDKTQMFLSAFLKIIEIKEINMLSGQVEKYLQELDKEAKVATVDNYEKIQLKIVSYRIALMT
jgi:hypothetical protein